jgi:hypothetical protein
MSRESITSGDTAGNSRRAATHYGPREIEDKIPSVHAKVQDNGEIKVTFSYDDLPAFGLDQAILRIPAGSVIKRAYLRVHTAFVGGTNLVAGLYQPDSTVVDADGLHTAILTAALTASSYHVGGGAVVGTPLAVDAQLVVATTGTYTAGKATLVVEYEPNYARA